MYAMISSAFFSLDGVRRLLPQSKSQNLVIGLHLLLLLAENRIAEFHSELEIVPEVGISSLLLFCCRLQNKSFLSPFVLLKFAAPHLFLFVATSLSCFVPPRFYSNLATIRSSVFQ